MELFYKSCQFILRVLIKFFFRLEIIGKEYLPQKGPAILCSNHTSVFDPIVLGCIVNPKVSFMAKEELFKIPVFNIIISKLGALPVKRGQADRKAIKDALKKLAKGGVFGLFPEGTRNKDKRDVKPLKGVGFIAAQSKASVIPITIKGDYKPFKKVLVIAHEPVVYDKEKYEEKYDDPILGFTKEIMESIYKSL